MTYRVLCLLRLCYAGTGIGLGTGWTEYLYSTCTVKTEIIENHARTLELPLLVRSVSQVGLKENPLALFSLPNPKPEILDVLAPFSIISVLTVLVPVPVICRSDDWSSRHICVLSGLGSHNLIMRGQQLTKQHRQDSRVFLALRRVNLSPPLVLRVVELITPEFPHCHPHSST